MIVVMFGYERVPATRRERMSKKNGSVKAGPSKAYVRLLEGKISSKEYAATVKRSAKTGRIIKK